ncbi:MAG: hypothetical protein KGL95_02735, partial [Patescibacteria group bacterium]|nr:hypothetical protein [Patescibacteria group bacterium]
MAERSKVSAVGTINFLGTMQTFADVLTGRIYSQTRDGIKEVRARKEARDYARKVISPDGKTRQTVQIELEAERAVQRSFLDVAVQLDVEHSSDLTYSPILNTTPNPTGETHYKRLSEFELLRLEREMAASLKKSLAKKDKHGTTTEETMYEIADAGTYGPKVTGDIEHGSPSLSRATVLANVNSIPMTDETMFQVKDTLDDMRGVRDEIIRRMNEVDQNDPQGRLRKDVIAERVRQADASQRVLDVAAIIESEYAENNKAKIRGNKIDQRKTIVNGLLFEAAYFTVYTPVLPLIALALAQKVPGIKDFATAAVDFLQGHGFPTIPDLADLNAPALLGQVGQSIVHTVFTL